MEFETSWGRGFVIGRLGQQHADFLESVLFSGEKPAGIEDGRIKLLVDPYQVRKHSHLSFDGFEQVKSDILRVHVEIKEPVHLACSGHLVDHIQPARGVVAIDPLHPGTPRQLWRVDLGKSLCQMIEADLWQRRDPSHIASLHHGVSQAVARHALSHKQGTCKNWGMDTLIRAVAGDLSPQDMRNRRREIREDAAALDALGVPIAQGTERESV